MGYTDDMLVHLATGDIALAGPVRGEEEHLVPHLGVVGTAMDLTSSCMRSLIWAR